TTAKTIWTATNPIATGATRRRRTARRLPSVDSDSTATIARYAARVYANASKLQSEASTVIATDARRRFLARAGCRRASTSSRITGYGSPKRNGPVLGYAMYDWI